MALAAGMDAHRIDTVAERRAAWQRDVGGGEAEPRAALGATDDLAGDPPLATEQACSAFDVALRQAQSNGAGGEHLAILGYRRDDSDAKTGALGRHLHRLRRAAAILAEEEIMADDDVAGAEAVDDDAIDKSIGRQGGKRAIEGQHHRDIEPELLEDRQLLHQRSQMKVRLLRMKELARMRLEDERAGRGAELTADGARGAQQRLVPAMHAVEVADGEHRTARSDRHILVAVNEEHGLSAQIVDQAGREGTMSTASPCTTGLPSTVHTHSNLARFFSGTSSATFAVATTVSPILTGALKFSDCEM